MAYCTYTQTHDRVQQSLVYCLCGGEIPIHLMGGCRRNGGGVYRYLSKNFKRLNYMKLNYFKKFTNYFHFKNYFFKEKGFLKDYLIH